MTDRQIAATSGLALSTVSDLSNKTTWAGVTVDVAERFSMACGVNLMRIKRHRFYLKHHKMRMIQLAPPSQRAMYGRLFSLMIRQSEIN